MIRSSVSAAIALIVCQAFAAEIPISDVVYTGAAWTQQEPQAATDGWNFLIAWRDFREQGGQRTIYAARLSADGQLLDLAGLPMPEHHDRPPNYWSNAAPAVAWTGSVYLVIWDDLSTRSAHYVRVDRDGNVLDASPQVIPGVMMLRPGAAASGSHGAILVYADTTVQRPSVYAVLFGLDGNVVKRDIALPHGYVDDNAVVASNGDSFLVSWRRWEGGTTGDFVVAAKVTFDGTVSEAQVLDTSLGWPAIASNGDDFAVLYVHRSKALVAAHLDRDGKLLSRTGLPETSFWPFPDNPIGRYGSGYVVALHASQSAVKGIVLDREGKPVSEIGLSTRGVAEFVVAFAANSHATLAVWPEQRSGVTIDRDIFGRVLGTDIEALISRSAARQSDPHIASSGHGYLAVWLEYLPDSTEIRATRLSPDGTPLDGRGLKVGEGRYRAPQVVFDGSNYLVAWFGGQPGQGGIMTSRVTPDGMLLDGPGGRVAVPAGYGEFGLGTNGRESLLAWTGSSENRWYYRAGVIGQDGILHAPFVDVPAKEHGVEEISVAGAADTWLVAWAEAWSPPWPFGPPPPVLHNVIAERISRGSLLALDADPLPIATSGAEERRPSVATNGTDFLVAWEEGTVVARTVTSSGLLGDPVTVGRGGNVSAAWSGNHYDVAWEDGGDLFTARFTEQPLPIALANTADAESHVAITATPAHGLFVLYERVASEAMYGYVSRVFARSVPPPTRMRSVRR